MLGRLKTWFKPKQKVGEVSRGYTVKDFVEDGLVPTWGYACWRPLNPRRQKELVHELKPLNARVGLRMDKSKRQKATGSGIGENPFPKDSELPLEVVCLVGLWEVEVDQDDTRKQSFDFAQESSLTVKVRGALNFPPGAEPQETWLLAKGATAKLSAAEKEKDRRWWLKITVTAILQVDEEENLKADEEDEERDHTTKLKVKCEKLEIERTVMDQADWKGDPMVDSWLPVADILQEIEVMLDNKLQLVIQGLDSEETSKHRNSLDKHSLAGFNGHLSGYG